MHFGDSYDAYSVGLDIAQHLLRDIVAYPVEVVRFKGSAQVGRGRSNATKVNILLHSGESLWNHIFLVLDRTRLAEYGM